MSEPYELKIYICFNCGEDFSRDGIINEDGFTYCKSCHKKLTEEGKV